MLAYIKIKIVSLAAEARLIKRDEDKFKARKGDTCRAIFWGLRKHRTEDVRSEARSALIAYGFLKGMPLWRIETQGKHGGRAPPDWVRIKQIVVKYGGANKLTNEIDKWKENTKVKQEPLAA